MPVFCSRQLVVPVLEKLLSDYAEGDIVLIHENGTPVEFYVAKHDYESDLNGNGRTLLVRKDCYNTQIKYDEEQDTFPYYYNTVIDVWLTNDYKSLFSTEIQSLMGETTFIRYHASSASRLYTRPIFLLSATECGGTPTVGNEEGSVLPIASSILRTGKPWWTRSIYHNDTGGYFSDKVFYVKADGTLYQMNCYERVPYPRPCFTLPAETVFDGETNIIK
jgi:hypothetical protein